MSKATGDGPDSGKPSYSRTTSLKNMAKVGAVALTTGGVFGAGYAAGSKAAGQSQVGDNIVATTSPTTSLPYLADQITDAFPVLGPPTSSPTVEFTDLYHHEESPTITEFFLYIPPNTGVDGKVVGGFNSGSGDFLATGYIGTATFTSGILAALENAEVITTYAVPTTPTFSPTSGVPTPSSTNTTGTGAPSGAPSKPTTTWMAAQNVTGHNATDPHHDDRHLRGNKGQGHAAGHDNKQQQHYGSKKGSHNKGGGKHKGG